MTNIVYNLGFSPEDKKNFEIVKKFYGDTKSIRSMAGTIRCLVAEKASEIESEKAKAKIEEEKNARLFNL